MDADPKVEVEKVEAAPQPDVSDIEARARAAAEQATAAQAKAEQAAELVARLKAAIAPVEEVAAPDPTQALLAELRSKVADIEARDSSRTEEGRRAAVRTALRSAGLSSTLMSDADLEMVAPKVDISTTEGKAAVAAWIDARPGLFPGVARGPSIADIAAAGNALRDKMPANKFMSAAMASRIEADYIAKQEARGKLIH
jgi:hypothetical protein